MAVNLFRQGTNTIKNSTFTTDLDAVGGKTISRTDDGTEVDVSFDLRLEKKVLTQKDLVYQLTIT